MTTVSDMLKQFGGMPVMPGIPFSKDAKYYFVDVAHGSDSNTGLSPEEALASLEAGYAKLTANQHDVLFYIASASGNTLADTLTWAKDYTHLIGISAPTRIANRARIFLAAAATSNPMIDITASGCIFSNFYAFHGVASTSSLICVRVSGNRNFFYNVHFAGIGHATGQGDEAGARSLQINGGSENTFKHCRIGVDTIFRSTTNVELEFLATSQRNTFEDCMIISRADNAGHLLIQGTAAYAMEAWTLFKNCLFYNVPANMMAGALDLTSACNISTLINGCVVFQNCAFVGCTDIAATGSAARIRILGQSSDDYSDFSAGVGLAIQPT